MKKTMEEQIMVDECMVDMLSIIRPCVEHIKKFAKSIPLSTREEVLNRGLEILTEELEREIKAVTEQTLEIPFPGETEIPFPHGTNNDLLLDVIPLEPKSFQEVKYPSGSTVLGITIYNRIPHLLYLRGNGSVALTSTILMLRLGQRFHQGIRADSNTRYLGSFEITGEQKPFHFILLS